MSSAEEFHRGQQFEIIDCGECGVEFAVPKAFRNRRREDHRNFYCPNGHPRYFPQLNEEEKLRERLKREKQQRQFAENGRKEWEDRAKEADYRARGQKAANTRLKKRVSAGVCPCCNRTFQDVARHMKSKHPHYQDGQS